MAVSLRCGLLIFFLSLTTTTSASSIQASDSYDGYPLASPIIDGPDYSEYTLSDSIQGALQIVESVEKMPTCQKMANAALIHDCASLDPHSSREHHDASVSSDHVLEESKKLYAARLAVCELDGAKVHVPTACQAFVPTIRAAKNSVFTRLFPQDDKAQGRNKYHAYQYMSEESVLSCIKALHSEGNSQGWTSYSGNLKHAAPLCHAMRSEVEKDEQIQLFKVLVSSTVDVSDSLTASKAEWDELRTQFHELRAGMRQFHFDLVKEDEIRQNAAQLLWNDLQRQVHDSLTQLGEDFGQLQNELKLTGQEMEQNKEGLKTSFDAFSSQLHDLDTEHHGRMSSINEEASALKDIVAYFTEKFQQDLVQTIYGTTKDLELANAAVKKNYDGLQQSDIAILGLMSHIIELSAHVNTIGEDMTRMKNANQRMHLDAETHSNRTVETFKKLGEEAELLNEGFQRLVGFYNGGWTKMLSVCFSFVGYTVLYSLFSFALWPKVVSFTTSGNISVAVATGLIFAYISTCYFGPSEIWTLCCDLYHSLLEHTTSAQRWWAAFALIIVRLFPRSSLGFWMKSRFAKAMSLNHDDQEKGSFEDEEALMKHPYRRLPFNDPNYLAKKAYDRMGSH